MGNRNDFVVFFIGIVIFELLTINVDAGEIRHRKLQNKPTENKSTNEGARSSSVSEKNKNPDKKKSANEDASSIHVVGKKVSSSKGSSSSSKGGGCCGGRRNKDRVRYYPTTSHPSSGATPPVATAAIPTPNGYYVFGPDRYSYGTGPFKNINPPASGTPQAAPFIGLGDTVAASPFAGMPALP